ALNLRKDELRGTIQSAETFRLLVDAVTDYAIYMLDPKGHVVSWNAGAQRFKGYTADEIIGQHFSRFYTREDVAAGLPAQVLQIAAREGKFESEGWRLRKDGTRFWAHVVVDPIRNPSGKLLGYAKITRDLTERQQAEQALRETQEEFRLLVQSVTDYALYMIDREGNVVSWNAGAERIKGYRPDEVIGRHFSTLYTEEDRAAGEPARALDAAEHEGRYEKEGWRVRKDGTRFWAHVVIDPIRAPDGTIRGFAKITRDITERRETQRKLDEAREALFQSQKMDAIGQLTGGVAHDFNNLLTAIIGSLELVQKRIDEDPRTTPLVANALQAAQRGATLTQRMLAFARRQELTAEPTDIRLLVSGMADLLDRSLGSTIRIVIRFTPSIGRVMVDRNQLEMALLNLAVNARDAMPSGGELLLEAHEETLGPANGFGLAPGRYAVLSVIDQGEGMDEATLRRATEPFYTTKGLGKGTGLGLSMVHGLAEQLGGRLRLQSVPGEGTTASLWLPVIAQPAVAETEPPAPEPEPPQTRPLAILAVDDDGLVLINTAAMLEDRGHRVAIAYSAREALELLAQQRFDLLITDQGMPGMTGAELIERVEAQYPDLPIVLATGYAELPPGLALAVPRIAKPFRQQQLLDAVARAVKD
ncbi:MAG: PAS domain S-box protein, partial [Alphaproteobacteria bacterium]